MRRPWQSPSRATVRQTNPLHVGTASQRDEHRSGGSTETPGGGRRKSSRFLVIVALAGAMIAGACSSTATTEVATDTGAGAVTTADGSTSDGSATEFESPNPTPGTTPTAPPIPGPTTTPGPLVTPTPAPAPTASPTPTSTCPGVTVPSEPQFVWGVADNDPDGGLVAHTEPDFESPVTRVLAPNEVALRPTGNCALAPNGAPWFELFNSFDRTYDWVNARYLAPASPACLHGESYGSRTRAGALDGSAGFQLFGPLPGVAIAEGDLVAFYPGNAFSYALEDGGDHPANVLEFRWYPAEAITIDVPCFGDGPDGPICLAGTVQVFSFTDPEFRINGDSPVPAERTGRIYAFPEQRGLREEFVEVLLEGDPTPYWVDPAVTNLVAPPCPYETRTGFDLIPCAVGADGTDEDATSSGDPSSRADHVHDLHAHVEPDTGCVRIAITFGTDVWSDDERFADTLPDVTVTKQETSTQVVFGPCGWGPDCQFGGTGLSGSADVEVDGTGVRALVARSVDGTYSVELLHPPAVSNVTFLEQPARILVDLVPVPGRDENWYGDRTVVAERLTTDRPANMPIAVRGWGRPFEAQGQWRVYRVDDLISFEPDVPLKLDNYASSDLDLVASGLVMTAGWTDAWGAFSAEIPALEPGIYAVLVGDTPPTDEGGFIASGQVVRLYEAGVDPGSLPPLPDQWWDNIVISD